MCIYGWAMIIKQVAQIFEKKQVAQISKKNKLPKIIVDGTILILSKLFLCHTETKLIPSILKLLCEDNNSNLFF
jgi:hypothetical protein